ncbi:MAG: hypothetical protein ACKPE1_27270 [Dolichospermum sp.]
MRYIFSGQDARTTRVSSFNFVLHQIGNRCNNRTLENLNDLFDNMVRYAVANTPYIP